MQNLAQTIESNNVTLAKNNLLWEEECADRREMWEAIKENTKAIADSDCIISDHRIVIRELARAMARAGR